MILGHVNAKLFRNVIRVCAHMLKMRAEAMHKHIGQSALRGLRSRSKILPRSAQILIVIGKAFTMHVNARSSNHDPNHVLDRDPNISERDSSPCEHSLCLQLPETFLKMKHT